MQVTPRGSGKNFRAVQQRQRADRVRRPVRRPIPNLLPEPRGVTRQEVVTSIDADLFRPTKVLAVFRLTKLFQWTAGVAIVLALWNGSGVIIAALIAVFAFPVIILCFAVQLAFEWIRDRQQS